MEGTLGIRLEVTPAYRKRERRSEADLRKRGLGLSGCCPQDKTGKLTRNRREQVVSMSSLEEISLLAFHKKDKIQHGVSKRKRKTNVSTSLPPAQLNAKNAHLSCLGDSHSDGHIR